HRRTRRCVQADAVRVLPFEGRLASRRTPAGKGRTPPSHRTRTFGRDVGGRRASPRAARLLPVHGPATPGMGTATTRAGRPGPRGGGRGGGHPPPADRAAHASLAPLRPARTRGRPRGRRRDLGRWMRADGRVV